ncbi:hypothetical protein NDU88_002112 [Pleurodeles waltl]|uniref:Uncharacterized protein n=1 Tax=Pleurodeles waltl TaxID=8319 RepID=A0AAV7VDD2_PLEWA|nr:hypothetical protein NDU88_002112 [Pleurodeles waltl]
MDLVSAVKEIIAPSSPSSLRPTFEISWRIRSIVDSWAESATAWCRAGASRRASVKAARAGAPARPKQQRAHGGTALNKRADLALTGRTLLRSGQRGHLASPPFTPSVVNTASDGPRAFVMVARVLHLGGGGRRVQGGEDGFPNKGTTQRWAPSAAWVR